MIGDDYNREMSQYSDEHREKLGRAYRMIREVMRDNLGFDIEEDQADWDNFARFVREERLQLEKENSEDCYLIITLREDNKEE